MVFSNIKNKYTTNFKSVNKINYICKMKKTIIFATSVVMFTSCTTNTTDTTIKTTNTDTTSVVLESADVTDSTMTSTYTVTASETK